MVLRMYGNCVCWRSKRQDIIARDTTESELIAMSSAANELMWIKQLCTHLNMTAKKPTLWGDNNSANLIAVNPMSRDRSNHIRVRHLRLREFVEHDEMDMQWVGTKMMVSPRRCKDQLYLISETSFTLGKVKPCGGVLRHMRVVCMRG